MNTSKTHSFATPVVREIPPSSIQVRIPCPQRELVLASLLVRP